MRAGVVRSPAGIVIIAAHPDDEVIGAASVLMHRGRDSRIVHVTDGAPRDMRDACAAGFAQRERYARARHVEALAALSCCGIPSSSCLRLDIVDQEATFALTTLTWRLRALLRENPRVTVITHPYEGGHPDHDAVAFAVHAAVALLRRERGTAADVDELPEVIEMTSYHAGSRGIETGVFLDRRGCGGDGDRSSHITTVHLDQHEREVKQAMMRCFPTQQEVLRTFTTMDERFRRAPSYDFLDPPHEGRLFYEQFDWGVDGRTWREHARSALMALDLEPPACL